jgi:hypothetical protein
MKNMTEKFNVNINHAVESDKSLMGILAGRLKREADQ